MNPDLSPFHPVAILRVLHDLSGVEDVLSVLKGFALVRSRQVSLVCRKAPLHGAPHTATSQIQLESATYGRF